MGCEYTSLREDQLSLSHNSHRGIMMPIAETDPDNDSPAGVAYRARHQVGPCFTGSVEAGAVESVCGAAVLTLTPAPPLSTQFVFHVAREAME